MSVTLGASKKPEKPSILSKKQKKGFYESKNKADKKKTFFKTEKAVEETKAED